MPNSNSIETQKTIPIDEFSNYHGSKLPELEYYENYESLKSSDNSVVIYPIFTQSAYQWNGFHDFYMGRCNNCLTVKIQQIYERNYASSGNAFRILEFLDYDIIDDVYLDKHPNFLKKYDKVILLHNEFVTKTEFEAITNHPNVIYLYPNALNSQVESDYNNNVITLIRGPDFPNNGISNGFDWKYNNSEYFDDWDCYDWQFYQVPNGHMLNCYPETILPQFGKEILLKLKNL